MKAIVFVMLFNTLIFIILLLLCLIVLVLFVFFFKQKTAYEMRISDWSSDVCSSDLRRGSPSRCRRYGRGSMSRPAGARAPRAARPPRSAKAAKRVWEATARG